MTITSNVSTVDVVSATDHPNIFLNQSEINIVKSRLNQDPWMSAYNKLITEANKSKISYNNIPSILLGDTPPSPFNNNHYYYSRAPYCYYTSKVYDNCVQRYGTWCCDTHINPNVIRTDYSNIIKFRNACRDMGLAYQLSGDSLYADNVVQWIRKWCIDSATKMNPTWTYYYYPDGTSIDSQPTLEIAFNMAGACYGADLIWNYSNFSSSDKATFVSYISTLLSTKSDPPNDYSGDGWILSHLMFVAITSSMTNNTSRINYVVQRVKDYMSRQIDTDGSIKNERTRNLSYCTSVVRYLLDLAELLKHRGIDLYNYQVHGKNAIEFISDSHANWILNPSSFPYTLGTWNGQNTDAYELAYTSISKKTIYKSVIQLWAGSPRYMYDERFIGPVTLTHGSPFV